MRISLSTQRSVLPALAAKVGEWWLREGSDEGTARGRSDSERPALGRASEEEVRSRSVQVRLEELSGFTEAYEDFVEILCCAAQLGAKPAFELAYESARDAALERYRPLRAFLGAFLPPDDRDAFRFETGRPRDAFEKLFTARNLQEFLCHDDGEMIFRIMKTREALQLYGDHLRLLATRVA